MADSNSGNPTSIRTKGDSFQLTKLTRRQDTVEVNRRELHDIKDVDLQAQFQLGIGQFLLSGAVWLAIEKFFDRPDGEKLFTPVFAVSVGCALSGLLLLIFGILSWRMKRRRIDAIFEETQSHGDGNQ